MTTTQWGFINLGFAVLNAFCYFQLSHFSINAIVGSLNLVTGIILLTQ